MNTEQLSYWKSNEEYIKRNSFNTVEEIDKSYVEKYGVTRTQINYDALYSELDTKHTKELRILECGTNVGNILWTLSADKSLHPNIKLYGVEPNKQARILAQNNLNFDASIVDGDIFNLPFRDNYFSFVITSGVLIHLAPEHIAKALHELDRVADFIWIFEYWSEETTMKQYRGEENKMWTYNYEKLFNFHLDYYPQYEKFYKFRNDPKLLTASMVF